jgi:hypothetical protein
MTIHDMAYFENMLEEIRKELLPQIPVIDQNLQQQRTTCLGGSHDGSIDS